MQAREQRARAYAITLAADPRRASASASASSRRRVDCVVAGCCDCYSPSSSPATAAAIATGEENAEKRGVEVRVAGAVGVADRALEREADSR